MKEVATTRTCGFFVEMFEESSRGRSGPSHMQRPSLNRIVTRSVDSAYGCVCLEAWRRALKKFVPLRAHGLTSSCV